MRNSHLCRIGTGGESPRDKTMDLDRKILLKINKQINKIERCIAF